MSSIGVKPSLVLSRENIALPEGAGSALAPGLVGLGAILIAITFIGGFMGGALEKSIAMHAFQIGMVVSVGLPLGALGFVMILQQVNAGWAATIRRQFENMSVVIWVGGVMFVLSLVMQLLFSRGENGAYLYQWMDSEYVRGDLLYQKKQAYLNVPFFLIRAILFFGIWVALAFSLRNFSVRQDTEGDRWLTAWARKLSAPGLLLFAITTAFAGFDWMMSLDHHWFSTMFGVYFFAVNMISCLAFGTLVLILLRWSGRLHGAFTTEHLHDMGKLLFGFTVFWSYIAFSQYFLIWYANIPEETGWFMMRKEMGSIWEIISWILPIGHFILPFIFLLPKPWRRRFGWIAFVCVWLLAMHVVELFWVIRPLAGVHGAEGNASADFVHWLDIVGIFGPVCVAIGVFVRVVCSGPLVPLQDPRMHESLEHRNYV